MRTVASAHINWPERRSLLGHFVRQYAQRVSHPAFKIWGARALLLCFEGVEAVDPQDIAMALRLEAPAARRGLDLGWLVRSQEAPGAFFSGLHAVLGQILRPGPKSSPTQGYDLYHDLVARHCGRGREALWVHDPREHESGAWTKVSFDALHDRCRRRASAWAARGVKPGSIVCTIAHAGEDAFVSLLAGLRLGACISLLEPSGPDFVARRLEALGAEFVVGDDRIIHTWLGGPESLDTIVLDDAQVEGTADTGSHTYAPEQVAALLFSPLRGSPETPVVLGAEQLFRGALRDGAVVLGLRPGDRAAAPGFDLMQHQPALLFASLIVSACWVEVSAASAQANPELLRSLQLRSVGLGASLRRSLSEDGGKRPRWDHVFKNPEEPADLQEWREFVEALELDDVQTSNILIEAASGGALLCSPRRPGKHSLAHALELCPAAGRAFMLQDFSGSGQASVGEAGVFRVLAGVEQPGDEGEPSGPEHIVLARRRGAEYLYGGSVEPRRSGRVYPTTELLACLSDCPFAKGLSVVALPAGGSTLAYRFVLVAYVGHETIASFEAMKRARVEEIERVILTRLGQEFLPDRIELFRGFARLRDGAVDHAWCTVQYLSGVARRKHQSPLFDRVRALRSTLARELGA